METVFDWLTVGIFGILAVIFLQRSIGPRPAHDRMINYFPPAVGCMAANYVGNEGWAVASIAIMVGVLAYIWFVIKPFDQA